MKGRIVDAEPRVQITMTKTEAMKLRSAFGPKTHKDDEEYYKVTGISETIESFFLALGEAMV